MVQVRQFAHMPRPHLIGANEPRSRLHSIQPFALASNGVAQLGVKIRAGGARDLGPYSA
jgi:hypothetical protein